jgi:hypothetical protein
MTASSELGSKRTSTSAFSWGFDKQKLDSKVLSRPSTEYLIVGPLGPSPSVRKPITRPAVRFQVLKRLNQMISRQTASPRKRTAKQMATSGPGLIGFLANNVSVHPRARLWQTMGRNWRAYARRMARLVLHLRFCDETASIVRHDTSPLNEKPEDVN